MTKTKTDQRRQYCYAIADGDEVHVTYGRGKDRTKYRYRVLSLAKFKEAAERWPADLRASVTLTLCRDSEEKGTYELGEFLEKLAAEKGFRFYGMYRDETTAEAVDRMGFQNWINDDSNFMGVMRNLERKGIFKSFIGTDGKLYFERTAKEVSDHDIGQPGRTGLDS